MAHDSTLYVVCVNASDEAIGTMEKIAAHKECVRHRAISVFIFNRNQELLLQRRAAGKYHSSGLWSNTCCGHPLECEDVIAAGERRLWEELGILCPLRKLCETTYCLEVGEDLYENEYLHVLVGTADESVQVRADPREVASWRWLALGEVKKELETANQIYTPWFPLAFHKVDAHIRNVL